jgi:hypothetical protein
MLLVIICIGARLVVVAVEEVLIVEILLNVQSVSSFSQDYLCVRNNILIRDDKLYIYP